MLSMAVETATLGCRSLTATFPGHSSGGGMDEKKQTNSTARLDRKSVRASDTTRRTPLDLGPVIGTGRSRLSRATIVSYAFTT